MPANFDLEGRESALSTAKAAALLDWTPAYSWHDDSTDEPSEPTWL